MSATLCIVAARGGSKGVARKNVRPIGGTTLTGLAVDQAIRVFDRVLVSTDDAEIAEIAIAHGGIVPFVRPEKLATDTAGKIPVLEHAVHWWESNHEESIDVVVDLSCTTPLRRDDDIRGALTTYERHNEIDNVISVSPARENPYFNQVQMEEDHRLRLVLEGESRPVRRQAAPEVYAINGAIYVWDRNALQGDATAVVRPRSIGYPMPADRSVDIDTEIDFMLAELLMQRS